MIPRKEGMMKFKVWQIVVAGLLAMAGFGLVLQATGLAPKPKGKATEAMYLGGIVAVEMATAGAVKPTAEKVEALAREAATKKGVDAAQRGKFVDDFELGFWTGWKTATR